MTLTFTKAAQLARAFGFTIRREVAGELGLVVYAKGTGADWPAAYFTDCPEDALRTACHMAATPLAMATLEELDEAAPACATCGEELDAEARPHGECWDCAYSVAPAPAESRQVRRARERAEAKARTRPGPFLIRSPLSLSAAAVGAASRYAAAVAAVDAESALAAALCDFWGTGEGWAAEAFAPKGGAAVFALLAEELDGFEEHAPAALSHSEAVALSRAQF